MKTVVCWLIHRRAERPQGVGLYEVAEVEVEKIVSLRKLNEKDLKRLCISPKSKIAPPERGSILLLRDGGVALCHHPPKKAAEQFGWAPRQSNNPDGRI